MSVRRTILVFGVVLLAFDGFWDVVAARVISPDWLAILLSILIYIAAGGVAAAPHHSVSDGASAGVAVGALDAAFSWLLFTVPASGRLLELSTWAQLVLFLLLGIVFGALWGTIGGALAQHPLISRRLAENDEPA